MSFIHIGKDRPQALRRAELAVAIKVKAGL